MKRISIILFFSLLMFVPVLAQNEAPSAFDIPEVMPQYPGGTQALVQFLSEHIVYPSQSVANHEEGKALVQFIVEKDGSIGNVSIARSSGYQALDNEAMRVMNLMPNWIPGTLDGKPIRVRYTVPVNFRLPDTEEVPQAK